MHGACMRWAANQRVMLLIYTVCSIINTCVCLRTFCTGSSSKLCPAPALDTVVRVHVLIVTLFANSWLSISTSLRDSVHMFTRIHIALPIASYRMVASA